MSKNGHYFLHLELYQIPHELRQNEEPSAAPQGIFTQGIALPYPLVNPALCPRQMGNALSPLLIISMTHHTWIEGQIAP